MKVTTAIILDTRRHKKDGKYPVKLRLTYQRQSRIYNTGYDLTEEDFKRVTGSKARGKYKDIRFALDRIEKKALSVIKTMDVFTFEKFKKLYFREPGNYDDAFFTFERYIKDLKNNAQINTAAMYETALRSLKNFYHRDKFAFVDITPKLLYQYQKYMELEEESRTTISIYTRCIRTIYNKAIRSGDADKLNYPFGQKSNGFYEIQQSENIKKALSKADIKKLFEYEPLNGSPEHFYRDLFLFSYLCNGMNLADILRLRHSNIQGDTIVFIRHKTAHNRQIKPVLVEVTEPVKDILTRWETKPVIPNNYVFNILTGGMTPEEEIRKIKSVTRMLNTNIKRIAAKIGIQQNISSYSARHSFATVLKLSGESIAFISEALGHSNIKTTENYLSSFDSEQRRKAAEKLTDF